MMSEHQSLMERIFDLFDAALKFELKGDESYINIGAQYLWGWCDPADAGNRNVPSKGYGTRIIAVNASPTGWVV